MAASTRPARGTDVVIIGAGVIGLGIAWRLAQRGALVTVFDKGVAGAGASHAAAGMLAACVEAEPGEEALVVLGRRAQAAWPKFAAELEAESGISVDLRSEGTLVVAPTADDAARLRHQLAFQQGLALPVEWISGRDARRREPHLGTLAGAVSSPQDHQVDNRKLVAALRAAAEAAGVEIREHTAVKDVLATHERVMGVHLDDGTDVTAAAVVIAAGAGRAIGGIGRKRPPVRPIKGQMLALQRIRRRRSSACRVGANVHLVPRLDGRLPFLAPPSRRRFDTTLTAGGVLACWRPPARGAGDRGIAARRHGSAIGRAAATMRRSWAADRWMACSMRPATIATAFCWRRSRPPPWRSWSSTVRSMPRSSRSGWSALRP